MKTRLMLLVLLLLTLPFLLPGAASADCDVILPAGYEDLKLQYPVVYILPQDGFKADDSGLAEHLKSAMETGSGMGMILVRPSLAEGDPMEQMQTIVREIDGKYRTLAGPEYRVAAGTGTGGYLAYALTLAQGSPFGSAVSIRGDFASRENPWLPVCGSVQEKIEKLYASDQNALNRYDTYMDAPVDDIWTDMEGSTDDLGALMISYGTGSAFHEFTVRPGSFDDAFLTESSERVMRRLTKNMLQGIAEGQVIPEKTVISEAEGEICIGYEIRFGDRISDLAPEGLTAAAVVTLSDLLSGTELKRVQEIHSITGGEVVTGSVTVTVPEGTASMEVRLSAELLNTSLPLAQTALTVEQSMVTDGDFQQMDLSGDWCFRYTGKPMDLSSLTAEEYESWPVVQPGLAWWTKGFGNISEETVSSPYGPDYFDYFIVGNAYYVKRFLWPEQMNAQELMLSVGYVDDRCEVFLNGVRVGATGMDENGQPNGETTWADFSAFELDPGMLKSGEENTLIVRAYNDTPYGGGGWYKGPIGIYSRSAFEAAFASDENPRFYEESFSSTHAAAALRQPGSVEEKYLIYLPEGYETSERSYPTMVLLHQFNSDHTSYRTDHVESLLDEGIRKGLFDEMIVVIPNSSESSWWRGEWEKMITEELIPHIDRKYRTIRDPRFRFTAGCSMGGQGAYSVALRNPAQFSGAVSFFGAFSYGGADSPNAIVKRESKEYLDTFCFYCACGNQDSYGFGVPAIQLHQQLRELGVAHRFFIENGGHDSAFYVPYFQDALAYARANMYRYDGGADDMLTGEITLAGLKADLTLTVSEEIAGYLPQGPASASGGSALPVLMIPLTLEVWQNDEAVYTVTDRDVWVAAEKRTRHVYQDLTDHLDPTKDAKLVLKAALFDRVIQLCETEIRAR